MASSNKINIVITAKDKASKPLRAVSDEMEYGSGKTSKFGAALSSLGGVIAKTALVAGALTFAALSAGAVKATTAAWSQVSAVEQATVALGAYEKNGSKVDKVLKGLVGYARSDMGVLFNRKDLFEAAQGLKIMGDNTGQLTDHVKIMSRSVGLGLSTWTDLNRIVGRIGSTGQLAGDDFDNLTKAGYKLDPALRNSKVSFDELFKAMDKGIPVDAMKAQAETIKGEGIRFETAFRGIGNAILNVDADTNKFVKGGLGDRFRSAIRSATTGLKDLAPVVGGAATSLLAFTDGITPKVIELGKQVGDYLGPKFVALWETIETKVVPTLGRLWHEVIEPFLPVIGELFVGAIGLAIDALNLTLIAISGLVDFFNTNKAFLAPIIGAFVGLATVMAFNAVFNALTIGFTTLRLVTIPSAMASVGALKLLIATPMVMPAIAIGAAIAAIWSVVDAHNKAMDAIKNQEYASNQDLKASKDLMDLARRQYDAGKIDKKEFRRLVGVAASATGTNYAPGGRTLVGEHGPEIVNMPRGAQVTQAYRTRSQDVPSSGGHTVVIQNMNINNGGDENRMLRDIGFALETAS